MAGRVDISARSVEDWSQGPSVRLAMEAGSHCSLPDLHDCPPRVLLKHEAHCNRA
jgi:hypothetical protein